jgi:hypothetical protein
VVALVALVIGFWISVFAIFFIASGTSVRDLVSGKFEPLPHHLGTWIEQEKRTDDDRIVEERYLLGPGDAQLVYQRRYLDSTTRSIVKVDAEVLLPRKRRRGGE